MPGDKDGQRRAQELMDLFVRYGKRDSMGLFNAVLEWASAPSHERLNISMDTIHEDGTLASFPMPYAPSTTQVSAVVPGMRKAIERELHDAENPVGMSVHDGKVRIDASKVRYLLRVIDRLEASPSTTQHSDADFAIEHGRYLADAAEAFLESYNEASRLELADEQDQDAIETAEGSRADHYKGLEQAVYEFRKRAARADLAPPSATLATPACHRVSGCDDLDLCKAAGRCASPDGTTEAKS